MDYKIVGRVKGNRKDIAGDLLLAIKLLHLLDLNRSEKVKSPKARWKHTQGAQAIIRETVSIC